MRLLKLIAVCLLLSLGAAACASYPNAPVYQEMLDTAFKGQHIDKMVEEFGPPDEKTANSYAWTKSRSWTSGGYWYDCSYTKTNVKTLRNKNGEVIGTIEEDVEVPQSCYEEEQFHRRWCNTTAFFDALKTITGFKFDGHDMNKSTYSTYGSSETGCYINTSWWPAEVALAFKIQAGKKYK